MTSILPNCPNCCSSHFVKNGRSHNDKQKHRCNDCGRQFVKDPQNKIISAATKRLIDKLLLKKLPLAGIAPVYRQWAVCYNDFGKLTKQSCLVNDIIRWAKKVGEPIRLSSSTALYHSEYQGWCAKHYRFLRR